MATDFVGLSNTALEGTDNFAGRCYLTLIIVWCCLQVGQWQSVCSLAGQVSFGRSSGNRQLLLHTLLYSFW